MQIASAIILERSISLNAALAPIVMSFPRACVRVSLVSDDHANESEIFAGVALLPNLSRAKDMLIWLDFLDLVRAGLFMQFYPSHRHTHVCIHRTWTMKANLCFDPGRSLAVWRDSLEGSQHWCSLRTCTATECLDFQSKKKNSETQVDLKAAQKVKGAMSENQKNNNKAAESNWA